MMINGEAASLKLTKDIESFISSLLAEKEAEIALKQKHLDELRQFTREAINKLESKLATQRQSVIEEAAKVADRRAEILNRLGSDANMKRIMTHAEIQFERVLEAKKIAEDIRALKNAEEKS